jgi:hypothetical protein
VLRQRRDVGRALAERRHAEHDQVQAVEEVLAERPRPDERGKIAVGRGEDAHVHRSRLAAPEHLVRPVLEDAQELHLRGRVELADLVEQDRAAVRDLEPSAPVLPRVGVRAPHVPEHLALEQRRRDAAEVDLDEGPRTPSAVPVDRLRDSSFPCRSRRDEDRGVGGRDAPGELEHAEELRVGPQQPERS